MNPITEQTLTEKIQMQARQIDQLRHDLQQTRRAGVDPMLGLLRLRGAVLLYIERDGAAAFKDELAKDYGVDVASAVENHLFTLENAPVTPIAREALRGAFQHGMTRW